MRGAGRAPTLLQSQPPLTPDAGLAKWVDCSVVPVCDDWQAGMRRVVCENADGRRAQHEMLRLENGQADPVRGQAAPELAAGKQGDVCPAKL